MPKKKLCDCTIREILAYAIDHTDEIEVQSCVGKYQDDMTKKIEIFAKSGDVEIDVGGDKR
jgi:hypothetical protein